MVCWFRRGEGCVCGIVFYKLIVIHLQVGIAFCSVYEGGVMDDYERGVGR